jgi:NAD(P)H-nitrite reductase large subunit
MDWIRVYVLGVNHPRVLTLRSLSDMFNITNTLASVREAVVVGAGFIGLEMAEQLVKVHICIFY